MSIVLFRPLEVTANALFIRPLPPGTCYLTKIRMLPLAAGPLQIEAVKVVDMGNNDSTTIKDLPNIIAVPPKPM